MSWHFRLAIVVLAIGLGTHAMAQHARSQQAMAQDDDAGAPTWVAGRP